MSELFEQVKAQNEKTLSLYEVVAPLLDDMVDGAAKAIGNTTYPDADTVADHIRNYYTDAIVDHVYKSGCWKTFLVTEIDWRKVPKEDEKSISDYVNAVIKDAIWEEIDGGSFDLSRYIEQRCDVMGYNGEPGDDNDDLNRDRGLEIVSSMNAESQWGRQ